MKHVGIGTGAILDREETHIDWNDDEGPAAGRIRVSPLVLVGLCLLAATASAQSAPSPLSPTNIFAPVSTPASAIHGLSLFVLGVTGVIFVIVVSLLAYAVVRFRNRTDDDREPPQVYGSNQVELAWTVIPVLIVVALFMASARVIATIQKAEQPANAIEVVQDGRIYIQLVNGRFLSEGGTPNQFRAGLAHAIASGWLWLHESGTYVKFTPAGAEMFRLKRVGTKGLQ